MSNLGLVLEAGFQVCRSAYSGTLKYTHTKLANSTAAVTRNTQRRPKAAATAPPVNGPRELPRNVADAVMPYTVPRSARGTRRPTSALAVGNRPPTNSPTPNRCAVNIQ